MILHTVTLACDCKGENCRKVMQADGRTSAEALEKAISLAQQYGWTVVVGRNLAWSVSCDNCQKPATKRRK